MSVKRKTMARAILLTTLLGVASFCVTENSEAADLGKSMSLSSSLAMHQSNVGIENPGAAMAFRWPWQRDKRPPEPPRPQPRPGWDKGPQPHPQPRPPIKRKDPPRPQPGDRPGPRPGDRGPGGPGPRW